MLKVIGFCLALCFIILILIKPKRGIKKIKKQKTAIDIFKKLVLKKKRFPDEIFSLASFYHQGIPDIINNQGKTIKGIKPDFIKAIKYYEKLEKTGYSFISFSELANIYHYGYVGFEDIVNFRMAREYYLKMLFCPIKELKTQAIERIVQLNESENVPSHTGLQNINQNNTNVLLNAPFQENIQVQENVPFRLIVRNDTQNVHDPVVVKSVANSFKNLKNSTENIINNSYENLVNIIQKSKSNFSGDANLHNSRVSKSLQVLKSMKKDNSRISSLNETETGIIDLVYSKYSELPSKEKENFVHNVVLQLSDGVEFGSSVCAQGRAERLLSSFSDFNIKPLWAIKQEMMNKSPLIRKELMEKYNETEKKWIDEPSNKEQLEYSDFFDQKVKSEMKSRFAKEYVDKGLIELSSLEQELDSWI